MNINSFLKNFLKTPSQLINYQTVRWRRPKKPFWLGIAKSKMFIVPQPKIIPDEEKVQNKSLKENYQTQLNSLLEFVRNSDPKLDEIIQKDSEGRVTYGSTLQLKISKSFENNATWNAESARRRNERVKEMKEKCTEKIFEEIDMKQQKMREEMEFVEEVVRKEKILSKSYITPENIDEAIENCLDRTDVYDFAIDLQGNRYPGNEALTYHLNKNETKAVPSTHGKTV